MSRGGAPDGRDAISRALDRAHGILPDQGPIGVFIHHNTLHAFQHLPFHEGVQAGALALHARPYLDLPAFHALQASGRIAVADIDVEVDRALGDRGAEPLLAGLSRRALWRALVGDMLAALGVRDEDAEAFILATALALPGWAGMFSRLERHPEEHHVDGAPPTLLDFLAVRLLIERSAIRKACHDLRLAPSWSALRHQCPPPPERTAVIDAHLLWSLAGAAGLGITVTSLEERVGPVRLDEAGGRVQALPRLAAIFALFAAAGVGMPGTAGFVADDLLLHTLWMQSPVATVAAIVSAALLAVASLSAFSAVFLGRPTRRLLAPDLSWRERAVAVTLLIALVVLGFAPGTVLYPADAFLEEPAERHTSAPRLRK